MPDNEHHFIQRAGWLRASVLGANDGLLSIASLLMGIGAATTDDSIILVTALAGLSAGALSMAAGSISRLVLSLILNQPILRLSAERSKKSQT